MENRQTMPQQLVRYIAGSRLYCSSCGEHICTFAKDILSDGLIVPDHFRHDEGQIPFYPGKPAQCSNCGAPWAINFQAFHSDDILQIARGEFAANQSYQFFLVGKSQRQAIALANVMDWIHETTTRDWTELERHILDYLQSHLQLEIKEMKIYKERLLENKN